MKKYDSYYEIIPANPDSHLLNQSIWSKIKRYMMLFCGSIVVFFVIALAGVIALALAIGFFVFLFFKRAEFSRKLNSFRKN